MANILIKETMSVHYVHPRNLKRLQQKLDEQKLLEPTSTRFIQLQKQIDKAIEKIQYDHYPTQIDFVYEK